jgi:nitrogen PTS system EIIA component
MVPPDFGLHPVREAKPRRRGACMDLRVNDVAKLLGESEETIYRWAREGTLPAQRLHEQYCFNRVQLQEWASTHGRRLPPGLFAPPRAAVRTSLRTALERGGIYYGVGGTRRDEVLAAVARLVAAPAAVDVALLEELLVSRERMASTGIGEGIAIPHTRDPLIVHIDEPILMLCFLASPVDFHSIDGKPVNVLFTLLSPAVQRHLHALSRLAFMLHDPLLRELLRVAAPAPAILDRVQILESGAADRP